MIAMASGSLAAEAESTIAIPTIIRSVISPMWIVGDPPIRASAAKAQRGWINMKSPKPTNQPPAAKDTH